jgi:serine/threonine protein phosphatase PrpC
MKIETRPERLAMRWEQTVEYAALSDIGLRRQNNEDSFAVLVAPRAESYLKFGHVFLVADGMGGHAVGELASKMAADMVPLAFQKLRDQPYPDALKQAIEETNTAIHTRGERNTDFRKMGTTCSTLVLSPEGALVGHVGDSRCYRVRANRIDQLTFDHSLQWELIRQGRQKREEILLTQPRNIITRCLGPQPEVDVDIEGPYSISHDDAYVLCSDGLTGLVQDAEIGVIVKYLPPVDACRLLVDLANLRGGGDNITVIVARVGALPEGLSEQSIPLMPSAPDAISWGWFGDRQRVAVVVKSGRGLVNPVWSTHHSRSARHFGATA